MPVEFGRTALTFGSGMMTAMSCGAGPTSDVERVYLESIRPAVSWIVDDTALMLTSPTAVWVFERVEPDAGDPVT